MVDCDDVVVPKYKMIFLGDQGVGKSCIINRYVNDAFDEEYQATIGLDFQSKNLEINDTEVRLLLYDTAGQEKFRSLIPSYIRQANIIVFVYDVTREDTFESLPKWYLDVTDLNRNAICILIANKVDLEDQRKVSFDQGKKFAEEKEIIFIEVSAKTGKGFDSSLGGTLFGETISELIRSKFNPAGTSGVVEDLGLKFQQEPPRTVLTPEDQSQKKKKKCC